MEKYQRFLIRIWMWLLLCCLPVSAFAADEVTLQLLWKNQFEFAGYYVAKEKGFYRDLDLEVQIKEYDFGIDVTKEVLSQKADFGVGYSTVILDKMNGKDVFLLAAVFQHSPLVLLAKKSPDLKNITDLRGKRIMSTPYDAGSASLTAMLKSNDVLRDDYTKLDHSFNVDDIINGKTDAMTAYLSNQPFLVEEKGFEYTVFNPKDYGFDFYSDILFTSLRLFEKNPQLVERFYQASMRGWKYAFSHIDETVDLILKKYNTQNKSRDALLYEANALKKMAYDEGVQFGAMNQDRIRQIAQVYRLLGITQKFESLENLVYEPSLSSDIDLTPEEKTWLAAHKKIVVGGEKDWAPFDFVDEIGQYTGIANDYLKVIGEKLGIEVEIITGPSWNKLLSMIRQKEIDVLPAIYSSKEREAFVHFTAPYFKLTEFIFSRTDDETVSNFADLEDKTIVVVKGYTIEGEIRSNYPEFDVITAPTIQEALKKLITGEADAFIGDIISTSYNIKELSLVGIKPTASVPFKGPEVHMAVRKDWPILANLIDKTLKAIPENEHNAIKNRWMSFAEKEIEKKRSKVSLSPKEQAWLGAHPKIRLGVDPAYPPFEFIGKGGAYLGMASDYLSLLNERLGIDMRIVPGLTWTQVIEKVKKDEVDALPAVINTEGRRAYLNFTQPYMIFPLKFLSRKDQPPITGFEDLAGKKLTMVKEYFYVEHLLKNHPDIQPYFVDTPLEALKAVSRGKANAFIGNLAVAAYLVQVNNLIDLRMDSDVDLELRGLCYGIRKDWPELVSILDKAIDSISQEKHKEIRDKWVVFGAEKEAEVRKVELTEKEREWLNAHPVIRVHNEWNWPPFNYNKDGKPTGLSIDYMNLLANRIGIEVEYISGEWGELLDQAFNKKLDVMLNIVKTPERQKHLLYTDSYVKNPNVIITRKESSISDTQSLFGKKVAYPEGFFYDEVLKTTFPEIIRVPMKDTLETLKAVQFGKVDAALGELAVVNYLIRENLLTGLAIKGMFDSGNPEIEKLNIAVRNDWPTLATILDKAQGTITPGEHRQLQSKWFGEVQRTDDVDPALGLNEAEKQWLKKHPTIRLGDDFAWPPLIYKDDNGNFAGIASSYTESFSKKLGIDFLPQFGLNWKQVLEGVKSRKLDAIPAVVRTPEREAFMAFTKPYTSFPIVVVTRKDHPYIDGLSDLAGKRVGVVKGYTGQKQVTEGFPSLNVIPLETVAKGLDALANGKVDAFVGNLGVINHEMNQLGLDTLKIAAPTPFVFNLSFGVRKDWPELVDIIDKAIAAMTDQEKAAIKNTWMGITVQFGTQLSTILKWVIPILFVILIITAFVVIWNRRLGREVSERKQKEKLIMIGAQISQSLTVGDNLKETLQSITEIFVKDLNMPLARIWIVDETENDLKLQASSGLYSHIDGEHERMSIGGDTKIGRVVFEQRPHISNSIQDDPYIKDKDWAREQGLTSYAGIPMVVEGRSVGAFVVFSRDAIQEDTSRTILSIADSIAVAIERNRAEETVLASERKIRGMSESSLDAMIMIDGKANIIFWNPAAERIFGYSAEEVMSRNLHDLVLPPEDRELAYKGVDEFIQTGKGKVIGVVIEHKALRKDGSMFPAEIAVSALQMDNEWYAVGTVRDITDRKQAEEELQQHLQDLERFSSMATGREEKMIELKEEINQLLEQAGQRKKYTIVE